MAYYIDARIKMFGCIEEIKAYIEWHKVNEPFIVRFAENGTIKQVELVVRDYLNGKALALNDADYKGYIKEAY